MKLIYLTFAFVAGLTSLYALADDDMNSVSKRERALELHSDILDAGYEMFSVQELRIPLAEHAYLIAKQDGEIYKIQTSAEFSRVVEAIRTTDEALELARLLSSQELRSFLQDVFYAEVYKKIEAENKDEIIAPWFRLDAEEYEERQLHPPLVKEEEGHFSIERFVASYPRADKENGTILPAQLLRILERIDGEGNYRMEIKEILTEGEQIHKILLFTK